MNSHIMVVDEGILRGQGGRKINGFNREKPALRAGFCFLSTGDERDEGLKSDNQSPLLPAPSPGV